MHGRSCEDFTIDHEGLYAPPLGSSIRNLIFHFRQFMQRSISVLLALQINRAKAIISPSETAIGLPFYCWMGTG